MLQVALQMLLRTAIPHALLSTKRLLDFSRRCLITTALYIFARRFGRCRCFRRKGTDGRTKRYSVWTHGQISLNYETAIISDAQEGIGKEASLAYLNVLRGKFKMKSSTYIKPVLVVTISEG
jgi:hypothetical protein